MSSHVQLRHTEGTAFTCASLESYLASARCLHHTLLSPKQGSTLDRSKTFNAEDLTLAVQARINFSVDDDFDLKANHTIQLFRVLSGVALKR